MERRIERRLGLESRSQLGVIVERSQHLWSRAIRPHETVAKLAALKTLVRSSEFILGELTFVIMAGVSPEVR